MGFLKSLMSSAPAVALLISTAQASAGCGQSHNFVGQSREFSFNTGGRDRTYRIHLPSSYKVNDERPLLIAFHGAGGNPADFEQITQYANETLNPDWITVFPAGVNGTWEGPSYAVRGVDDLAFVSALVDRITDNYCVDESRLYAVGQSNGGGFANTLACSAQGAPFAAFGLTSAALYTDVVGNEGCSPSRSPLPLFETHGNADMTIDYDGGEGRGGPIPAVREWLSRWAVRNRCSSGPVESDFGNGVTEFRWTCAGVDGLLRHFMLDGHGHTFPGPDDHQLFVTPVMLEWLSQFSN